MDGGRSDTELLRAAPQQVVVLVRRRQPWRDVQPPFGTFEPGSECPFAELGQVETLLPDTQRCRWRAKRAGPVHRRRTADTTALQDVDGLVARLACSAFLVEA